MAVSGRLVVFSNFAKLLQVVFIAGPGRFRRRFMVQSARLKKGSGLPSVIP
jgi:hypothetical protein